MPMMERPLFQEEEDEIKARASYNAKKYEQLQKTIELEMQNDKEKRRNEKIENANNKMVLETANEALKLAKGEF